MCMHEECTGDVPRNVTLGAGREQELGELGAACELG